MADLVSGEFTHRGLFRGLCGGRNAENTAEHCHQQASLQIKAGKHTEKSFFLMSVIPILFAALSMRLGGRLNNFLRSEIYTAQAKFRCCAQLVTKGDLHKEVGLLHREIGLVHKEMANQTKWMISAIWVINTLLAVTGLCMTAANPDAAAYIP
ncbi:hypothetical protein [Serratia quinivorans]|uniref:hypothetical protein n=1 Tax=Serratia quinivorans TaxID=137545 RepID=UPI0021097B75|nr:hypothetical protein [Serratia quinivorans]